MLSPLPPLFLKAPLKWSSVKKLDPQIYNPSWGIWESFPQIHEGTRNKQVSPPFQSFLFRPDHEPRIRLAKGLYVGLFLSESSPKGANVLVPSVYRQMCPVMKLRDQSLVSLEEWHYLTGTLLPAFSLLFPECSRRHYFLHRTLQARKPQGNY